MNAQRETFVTLNALTLESVKLVLTVQQGHNNLFHAPLELTVTRLIFSTEINATHAHQENIVRVETFHLMVIVIRDISVPRIQILQHLCMGFAQRALIVLKVPSNQKNAHSECIVVAMD